MESPIYHVTAVEWAFRIVGFLMFCGIFFGAPLIQYLRERKRTKPQ